MGSKVDFIRPIRSHPLLWAFVLVCFSSISDAEVLKKVKIYQVKASTVQVPNPEKRETYEPRNVRDGAPWSRWSSRFLDRQWLLLDLKEPRWIQKIVIYWQDAYAAQYSIDGKKASGGWVQIYSTEGGDGGEDVIELEPRVVRKLKLNCKKRATDWGFSIWEIEIFGDEREGAS